MCVVRIEILNSRVLIPTRRCKDVVVVIVKSNQTVFHPAFAAAPPGGRIMHRYSYRRELFGVFSA